MFPKRFGMNESNMKSLENMEEILRGKEIDMHVNN